MSDLRVHLVDGTYELFRHHFAVPSHRDPAGLEVGATRGVLRNVLALLEQGATHVAVATDHVIESFRNHLWPGYKSSAGIDPELLGQFGLLEDALRALGVVVLAMVELEADDGLASAAAVAAADPRVEQVLVLTADKDLAQVVTGQRVVQVDRRKKAVLDEDAVVARYGIGPSLIPDYLALVGDSADGFPGIPGFGAKTAAAVLARYGGLEAIPELGIQWDVPAVRGAGRLAASLAENRQLAELFRLLATLRIETSLVAGVDALEWRGPAPDLVAVADRLDAPEVVERATRLAEARV